MMINMQIICNGKKIMRIGDCKEDCKEVILMSADGPAPSDVKTSADVVMNRFIFYLQIGLTVNSLRPGDIYASGN